MRGGFSNVSSMQSLFEFLVFHSDRILKCKERKQVQRSKSEIQQMYGLSSAFGLFQLRFWFVSEEIFSIVTSTVEG